MVSSDVAFTIGWFVFLIALAVIVYRLVWLERVRPHFQSRSAPEVSPATSSPEWSARTRADRHSDPRALTTRPREATNLRNGSGQNAAIRRGRAEWNE